MQRPWHVARLPDPPTPPVPSSPAISNPQISVDLYPVLSTPNSPPTRYWIRSTHLFLLSCNLAVTTSNLKSRSSILPIRNKSPKITLSSEIIDFPIELLHPKSVESSNIKSFSFTHIVSLNNLSPQDGTLSETPTFSIQKRLNQT